MAPLLLVALFLRGWGFRMIRTDSRVFPPPGPSRCSGLSAISRPRGETLVDGGRAYSLITARDGSGAGRDAARAVEPSHARDRSPALPSAVRQGVPGYVHGRRGGQTVPKKSPTPSLRPPPRRSAPLGIPGRARLVSLATDRAPRGRPRGPSAPRRAHPDPGALHGRRSHGDPT